ncbi:MAG TPA: hypothetical protein VNX22_10335 [Acidobacteriaceae bacterium]|jgi:hypothetical protein|nr:hypothetical protein [Acidobacteriaceae bacterium]
MATAHDAELILKLYELRREPVMREARKFMLITFWPETVDEFLAVQRDFGEQNNAYLRQFVGYWEMAASMVLRGALDADLFFDSNNEPFFVFAKMHHLRPELKSKAGIDFMPRIAELLEKYPVARQRFENTAKAVENRRRQRNVAQKIDL